MSVEDTLAERGKRYGDFTDHAEICQRLKLAMIAGSARWTRLSDVQKQALEVIADKIARILSGDPNYADNWHDIQGYAKLVEDRLPKAPMTFSERCAEIDAQVQVAVLGSKTNLTPHPDLVAAMRALHSENQRGVAPALSMPLLCPECGFPVDEDGTHYATCSKLTAPKEFVAEVEATFDGLENAASSAADQLMDKVGAEIVESIAVGTFVEDPFAGAPEWARYKAQDELGAWYWYELIPVQSDSMRSWLRAGGTARKVEVGDPNPNWRDTLIERTMG